MAQIANTNELTNDLLPHINDGIIFFIDDIKTKRYFHSPWENW